MFFAANDFYFQDNHVDLAFDTPQGWSEFAAVNGTKATMFSIGDRTSGPVIILAAVPPSITYSVLDPLVHMHRTDSFRAILKGDQRVGRQIYAGGAARLQSSGAFYGPEVPGPRSSSGAEPCWIVLCFADKRGYRIEPADQAQWPSVNAREELLFQMYDKVGCHPTLPKEFRGKPNIRSNLQIQISEGRMDLAFDESGNWPRVRSSQLAVAVAGDPVCGPVFLGVKTPPDAVAMPACTWATETVRFVVSGSCRIGGSNYHAGDIRIQDAETLQPVALAGANGLEEYIILGDRRGAAPRVGDDEVDAHRWAGEIRDQIAQAVHPRL
jgi:hypothetical protein